MILMSARQNIWVAENKETGEIASWTSSESEERVKESMERFFMWGLDPSKFQVVMFSLQREVGNEPKSYPKIVGNYFVSPDGRYSTRPSGKIKRSSSR